MSEFKYLSNIFITVYEFNISDTYSTTYMNLHILDIDSLLCWKLQLQGTDSSPSLNLHNLYKAHFNQGIHIIYTLYTNSNVLDTNSSLCLNLHIFTHIHNSV